MREQGEQHAKIVPRQCGQRARGWPRKNAVTKSLKPWPAAETARQDEVSPE